MRCHSGKIAIASAIYLKGTLNLKDSGYRKADQPDRSIVRTGADRESELVTHFEHRLIVAKHLALDRAQPIGLGPLDDQVHQLPSEPHAFEVRTNENRVFALVVIGIGVETHHSHHFAGLGIDCHERNRPRVIDLDETGEKEVAEMVNRREETEPQILFADRSSKLRKHSFVFGPNGSDKNLLSVLTGDGPLPGARIGTDGETRMTGSPAMVAIERCDPRPGIECKYPIWSTRRGLI